MILLQASGLQAIFQSSPIRINTRGGGGVLPKKLGRGVRPASQNPYPIYDQNLWFSLPYLWHNQKFDTLFMTWPLHQYPVSDLPYKTL